jgi:capsular exopolysaccharide synthesis family protein
MSRIFDALQRSGAEQSGIEYPDMISVATEVFEAARRQTSADPPATDQIAGIPTPTAEALTLARNALKSSLADFPSLEVSVSPSSRLAFFSEPDGLAAEKFRFLGVRIRQLQQTRTLKKVLITSSIPEEGKTLVAANLAGVLTRRNQKVLLIEGDMRRPKLLDQFGLKRLAGLGEWLKGERHTVTNVYHLDGPDFWLMPAGDPPSNPLELMQAGRLSLLMEQLTAMFDWIIVDSPPLLPLADTSLWARLTDGTLLITREGVTEKDALQRGLKTLRKSDLLGVVLNGRFGADVTKYYHLYPGSRAKEPHS